jgi:hypothetical protein
MQAQVPVNMAAALRLSHDTVYLLSSVLAAVGIHVLFFSGASSVLPLDSSLLHHRVVYITFGKTDHYS